MPTFDQHQSRPRVVDAEYTYRRPLRLHELVPAIGVAIGAGFLAFYVTRILLQRTPLRIERGTGRALPRASERAPRR